MSVVVLLTHPEEVSPLINWGAQFARARHLQLVAVLLRGDVAEPTDMAVDKQTKDPLLVSIRDALELARQTYEAAELADGEEAEPHPPFLPTCRFVPEKSGFTGVIAELRKQKAKLLVIGKHRKLKGDEPGAELMHELFRRAPCDTMLLRPGSSDGTAVRNVVVPAAGGPHAPSAIGWGVDLAMENDGCCTPLYVEPDIGDVSEAVGYYHLEQILRKAGVQETQWLKPRVIVAPTPSAGMRTVVEEGCDLVMIGASEKGTVRRVLFGTLPQRLLEAGDGTAVGVLRTGKALVPRLRDRIEDWMDMRIPQLDRQERIALFDRLQSGSRWDFDFLALMSLSTLIAALGLLQNSASVVIGAMLVAPLMTPLIACGLSLVQANWLLMRQALRAVGYGFLVAVMLGFISGMVHPVAEITGEIASRGKPNVFDLAIALFSGLAAAYALARPNLSAALPGVAIAAALVPPLATIGISLAFGSYRVALGSAMLFASNLTAIILGSAFVFHACGVHGSTENGRSANWARRVIMSLLVAGMALAVPLGTRVLKRASEFRRHRTLTTISKTHLENQVFTKDNGYEIRNIRLLPHDGNTIIELTILGPQQPSPEAVAHAAKICSEQLGRQVSVRVVTQLLQTADSTP